MENPGKALVRYFAFLVIAISAMAMLSSCSVVNDQAQAKSPKEIIVWTSQDIVQDPLAAKTSEQHFVTALENRTLFGLNDKGKIENDLAKSYSISKDGTKITVDLREEKFSNDLPVDSTDVKATLSRIAQYGGDYSKLLQNVKGYGEAKGGSDFFGITTPKNNEIDFDLITPDPFFIYHLAHPATAIIAKSSIAADGSMTSNVNSGQYLATSVSNEPNVISVFEPKDKKLPVVKVIRKTNEEIVKDASPENVDIILAAASNSDSFDQVSVPQLAVASWNIYVADSNSPFANVKFRKAILVAMDEKESIEAYSTRAISPTKFTGLTFDSTECSANCVTNAKEAKKLIKEIYPNGNVPAITIDIENNEIQQALATSAVKKLASIGVTATVSAHDPNELSDEIARGQVELFRFGWISDVAVGADQLVKSFKADSTENVSGVTDATLEKDISDYLKSATEDKRLEASKTIQDRIKELWLTRPVAHFHKIVTIDKSLKEVKFDFYGRVNIADIHQANG